MANEGSSVYAHPALITDLWRAANMYMSLPPDARRELAEEAEQALSALDDPSGAQTAVRIIGGGSIGTLVAVDAALYAILKNKWHPQDDAFASFGYSSEESGT
jgi:hypothetical protein